MPHQTFCGSFDENPDQACMKNSSEDKGTVHDEFFSFASCLLLLAMLLIDCVDQTLGL